MFSTHYKYTNYAKYERLELISNGIKIIIFEHQFLITLPFSMAKQKQYYYYLKP